MSLRARIAAAVAGGVAVVVLLLGTGVYLSVRSALRDEVDHALVARSEVFGRLHHLPESESRSTPPESENGLGLHRMMPPPDPLGGAPGLFQLVDPNGRVQGPFANSDRLPIDRRVLEVARTGRGTFLRDEHVSGSHVRILTTKHPSSGLALQVARPLDEVDAVLRRLAAIFAVVAVVAILAAAALGGLIARTALGPILRFIGQTRDVSKSMDPKRRLDESGPAELSNLAESFNRTLDALERSVEAQRHLVADASHEMRTPIAALRSNVQIFLESGRLPPAERSAMRDAILTELDELTELVADIVELARGADPTEVLQDVEVDEVVGSAVERAKRRSPGLTFDVSIEPTAAVHSPDRVARAVDNLLDNASKWSPADGTIDVRLADGTLTVRDRGPGFDPADLQKVFDRFYRSKHARRTPGSGLGLAIVRQAAESGGGFAEASNADDGGAIVRVSFGRRP